MADIITTITSQSLSNIDKAARQARADIAAAQPIQLLIRAMASGQYNGKPLQFSDIKDIAKYLGEKLVPDLKSVDVNNRVTPADPAEWVDFLLRAAGHAIDVTPVHVGQGIEGVGGSQVVEIIEEGGGGKTTHPRTPPGGIPPICDTEVHGGCIQNKKNNPEYGPEAISSHKRPHGLAFVLDTLTPPAIREGE